MIPAEGRFDYHYRPDLAVSGVNVDCIWNNRSLPIEKGKSISNPLTGFHDLFNFYDWNGDGELFIRHNSNISPNEDNFFPSYTEVDNAGNLHHTLFGNGDDKDIFKLSGNHKIAIGTNPSTAPLYTYASYGHNNIGTDYPLYTNVKIKNQQFEAYENRTIWLNNLSIEILSETVNNTIPVGMDGNPSKDLKIKIRWDDADVKNVRWCGNIVLQDDINDPLNRHTKINLLPNGIISLERGQSPTQHIKVNGSFTQPTTLTLKTGTETTLGYSSYMEVKDDSKLVVESGANVTLEIFGDLFVKSTATSVFKSGANIHLKNNAGIFIFPNSTLEIEAGANVTLDDGATIVVSPGGKLILGNGQVFLNGSNASIYINGILELPANTDLTMNGTGFYQFGVGNNIVMGQGSKVNIVGNGYQQHQMIKIDNQATVQFTNHDIKITDGDILYGKYAQLKVVGGANLEYHHINASYDGALPNSHATAALDVSNTHHVIIAASNFTDFSDAVIIHDYPIDCNNLNGKPNVNIANCDFDNSTGADVVAHDLQNTNLTQITH
ncbi:MAG: hypothetical protein RIQ33_106 [Bacteroidota bacterium]|jgi:hypothetical protein